MTSSEPSKPTQLSPQDQERVRLAKAKLLDGWISAISIDTCIFTENGNRLGEGLLGQIEKINHEGFELVFSDVTLDELKAHIQSEAEDSKTKLRSALRSAAKHWKSLASKDGLLDELLGSQSSEEAASKLLGDFVRRSKPTVLDSRKYVDVRQLLEGYFQTKAPFENSEKKKSEFPDAITLLGLEGWAAENGRGLVFVTKDKGCKSFCDGSSHLFAVHQLSEALALIQERNKHLTNRCALIAGSINSGLYPSLKADIEAAINGRIWDVDWSISASSSYFYENELEDVSVTNVEFAGDGELSLRPISYVGGLLVVKLTVQALTEATANFTFSIRDTIDHDWIPIGACSSGANQTCLFDVLVTFENIENDMPEICDVELISKRQELDFDYVEPDFRDEDPSDEKY